MFESIITIMILGMVGVMAYAIIDGKGSANIVPVSIAIASMLTITVIVLPLLAEQPSECIEERLVECELYNIPLEECEKDVTEEGPYYDKRIVTRYTKLTCTRWENGTVLQP